MLFAVVHRVAIGAFAAIVGMAGWCAPAAADRGHTLYSFCSKKSCGDGSSPSADLAMDSAGNLYGTTYGGGSHSSGALFQLAPSGQGGKWERNVLHSFCQHGYPCNDGASPVGKLIVDAAGNLYGTTTSGGQNGGGVVFELSPNGGKWVFRSLYAFCSSANCADGKTPTSGLTYAGAASGAPYDGTSPLYGTAEYGGAQGQGVAFVLTPSGRSWSESVIYNFCTQTGCADGALPWQALVMNSAGHLFGATYGRPDVAQYGVIFELAPVGNSWKERVVHAFCQTGNCSDGRGPNALTLDTKGALLGTAYAGGANNAGVVFRLVPRAQDSPYTVLYNFCSIGECRDGAAPSSDLLVSSDGSLYGTTYYGGDSGQDRDNLGGGTVFRLTHHGSFRVLRSFCMAANCTDGEYPNGGLLADPYGNLLGTTQLGGKHGSSYQGGTVFEIGR